MKDSVSGAKIFALSRPKHVRSMCQPGLEDLRRTSTFIQSSLKRTWSSHMTAS